MTVPSLRRGNEPRYVSLVKVGSGAYATVYVAFDPTRDRLVAVKALHPHLAEEQTQRDALVREARMLACVRDAHVVQLLEVNDEDGIRLVLEYVEGVTLGKWLVDLAQRDGRIPPKVVVQIGLDAASGLHAIHEARGEGDRTLSLVHRDVSPQNLLVGRDGMTKLSDFGTAKVLFEPVSETTEGSLKGKLGYMAPEYIRGASVDRRIDVFALGVVLWEAFSGKRLFRGQNEGETLDRVLYAAVPELAAIDEELAPFDAVLSKALARDPAQRFASALELRQALAVASERSGLAPDHVAVASALGRTFDRELEDRRQAITSKIARGSPPSQAPPRTARSRWTIGAIVAGIGIAVAGGALFLRGRAEAGSSSARATSDALRGAPAPSPSPEPAASDLHPPSAEPARTITPSADAPSAEPARLVPVGPRRRKPPPNPY